MIAHEINFDGLVGPTHNYCKLSPGNIAPITFTEEFSNPKEAALQGLKKMKFLADRGLRQAVLPPHERPSVPVLRRLGFTGTDEDVINKASKQNPTILSACSSAAAMWTANAATTSPSVDTEDGKTHFTPANLSNKFHRSFERKTTRQVFKAVFNDERYFVHHPALPSCQTFGDEGASNHMRFCSFYGEPGMEFFVFGKYMFRQAMPKPKYFPARQTYEAVQTIARMHGLNPNHVVLAQQSPIAIDAGVFHNDMIAVGNKHVLLYHEQAFLDTQKVVGELQEKYKKVSGKNLCLVSVRVHEVTLSEAVQTFLFNSQLVDVNDSQMALIAPEECRENKIVGKCIDRIVGSSENPISEVHYLGLRQSMKNGGGPACLRLRVVLTEEELKSINQSVLFNEKLYQKLTSWVEKHYRDKLIPEDLADYQLLLEGRTALDELTQILKLGSVYEFQRK